MPAQSINGVPRRQFLAGAGGTAAVTALTYASWSAASVRTAAANTKTDEEVYANLRMAWQEILTGGDFDASDPDLAAAVADLDDRISEHLSLIERSSGRSQVFTDLHLADENDGGTSGAVRDTYVRLQDMAIAYRTAGSRYENDEDVLADILEGLETTNVEIYHEGQPEFGNWWHWEIGAPRPLSSTCVLVYEHIDADALERYNAAIDHFVPDPHYMYPPDNPRHKISTGANRIDLCQGVLVRGIVGQDNERIQLARDGLDDVFQYVTSGDGFYRDGSFIQHDHVAYSGSYGVVLLGGFSRQLALLAGSPWQVAGPERDFAFSTVENTFVPVVYDNQLMDFIRGRAISRAQERDHSGGRAMTEHILRLARAADEKTAARWRSICKGWMDRSSFQDPLTGASLVRAALMKEVLNDSSIEPAPEPVNHKLFANMDRAIHRRQGWAFAISMCSKRVAYYEAINGENELGYHTGNGMTYLYNADNGQFTDEFWPTVDLNRLPGITVDTKPLPDRAGGYVPRPSEAAWTGGAVLDNEFAAVGMELEALMSSLRAKKSWFCLDEYIVALGAGITAPVQENVEPIADAYVRDGEYADTNYGSASTLIVKQASSGYSREAYLGFDLTGLPAEIRSATLNLRAVVNDSEGDEIDIEFHAIESEWDETTVTWNTRPSTGQRLGSVHVDSTVRWSSIDLTSYVRDHLRDENRRLNLGVLQDPPDGPGLYVQINGRASGESSPYLEVELDPDAATGEQHRIETVVENRNLHADGANALIVDGTEQPTQQGWNAELDQVRWAHLEGVGGYVFLGDATVHALREERTGRWSDNNVNGPDDPITRRYLTLWFDHGFAPEDASYAYVLLPEASPERTRELALDPGNMQILANTTDVQAVWVPRLGITAINFFASGTVRDVTVDAPCSVVLRERGDQLELAIADPTHEQTELNVKIDRPGFGSWTGDDTIEVGKLRPHIEASVDTEQAFGRTHSAVFSRR